MARPFSRRDFEGDRSHSPAPDPLRNATGTRLTPHYDAADELAGGTKEARREAGDASGRTAPGKRGSRFGDAPAAQRPGTRKPD